MKTETATALVSRKALIAKIAERHRSDKQFLKSFQVESHTEVRDEYTAIIEEEFERVQRASTVNPLSL
jgi:hypothetical protein